jgi:DNA/RNA endonuclease G (NUC1)
MKQIIYIIAFSLMQLGLYSQDTIRNGLYEIVYSQALEQPMHIKYKVLCPFGQASRTGMSFWKPDRIHTSDNEDYEDNVWDKGHMVPASSFSCSRDTLYQTFNYINCALQHQSLNRGAWARLEQFEKDLAKFYEVYVEIDVIFKGMPNRLTTGAVVPTGFKKTIRFNNKRVVLYFPNMDTSGKDWHEFIINE